MSEVKVNKVSPRSGTTVTIGDSGDTINIVGTLQNNGSPLAGDISSVVAGTGLSGGATSGVATLNIEAAQPTITSLGTITGFTSTGIDDNATGTSLTIASDGRTTLDATNEKPLIVHHSDGDTVRIGMNNNSTNSNEIAFESTDFIVKPGGFEKFRINSVGNTLINTSSAKGDDAGTFAPVLTVNGGSYDGLIEVAGNRSDADGAGVARLQFIQNSNSATYKEVAEIRVETEGTTANQRGGTINFRTRADGSTSTSERMRITSDGDVLIGDYNPDYKRKLTVSGNGSADTGLFMYDGGAGTYLNITTNGANGVVDLEANARTGAFPPLTFTTGANERMRIHSNGHVAIGTTASTADLELETTEKASGTNLASGGICLRNSGTVSGGNILPITGRFASGLEARAGIGFVAQTQDGIAGYAGEIAFYTMGSADGAQLTNSFERVRINKSGYLGVGTSTPDRALEISGSSNTSSTLRLTNTAPDPDNIWDFVAEYNSGDIKILDDGSERMRIDSSGTLLVGTTDTSLYNNTSGSGWFVEPLGSQQTASNLRACADWNRMGNDGVILGIWQNGTMEGDIQVSGSTVSYNGFTGTHWSRFQDNSKPTILRGTVLETLDEMCYWYNLEFDNKKIPHVLLDGQSDRDVITYNHEGTDVQATIVKETDVKHMMSKVSDTVDAKNVYGVFSAWDEDGEGYNDFYVASVGSFVVRIKANETIAKGDLLQSNGDGTAKVQTDDAVRSSSFAKILSTTVIETYEDGSYLVPCSLMC